MFTTIITLLLVLSIAVPMAYFVFGERTKTRLKRTLLSNGFSFFSIMTIAAIMMFTGKVSAAENALSDAVVQTAFISAALVTGLACIGAGIAVAASASAALGAVSENEKIVGKALIFVALAEGIALYGLLVSFTILGQIM